MTQLTCTEFADLLASKAPVPGGGGASALVGALAAALGSMVANYTVGKPKYAAVEEEVKALLEEMDALRARLLALVEEDAAAFEPLSRAYGIPKDAPGRGEELERCLRLAAQPPMELLRLCCRVLEVHRALADKGSVMVLSDVGTGAALALGAMKGALLNVKVNTKLMDDRACAGELDREAEELTARYTALAEDIYGRILERYM